MHTPHYTASTRRLSLVPSWRLSTREVLAFCLGSVYAPLTILSMWFW